MGINQKWRLLRYLFFVLSDVEREAQVRLATVLRQVLEHFNSGSVVALTPPEQRLAHRLQGALAAFDISSRVWSDPLVSGEVG